MTLILMPNPAWQFEHSLECNADKSFVWSFWTEVSNWERIEGEAVEWIKLDGPFENGAKGETKMPGHNPQYWEVTQVVTESTATIKMPLEEAVFYNKIALESLSPERTRITQIMSLEGPNASAFAPGMQMFEENAPHGLAKMVKAIESAYAGKDQ